MVTSMYHARTFADFHADLFHTLRRLGGTLGVNYCCRDAGGGALREVQSVFVSCPLSAWVAEFGLPQEVRPYYDSSRARWISSWQQDLREGRARCVGQFFQREPDAEWVVVNQISVCRQVRNAAAAS